MQLCRFILRESPQQQRSGILHENRIYETNGEQAIGIHELSAIAILPPLASVPTVRAFRRGAGGGWEWIYRQSGQLLGPLAEFEPPFGYGGLVVKAHVAAALAQGGSQLDHDETQGIVLAYSLALSFEHPGQPMGWDTVLGLGPVLTTPEEWDTTQPLKLTLLLDSQAVSEVETPLPPFEDMAAAASWKSPLLPGDLLLSEPIEGLRTSIPLLAGHRVQVRDERLGTLVIRLS